MFLVMSNIHHQTTMRLSAILSNVGFGFYALALGSFIVLKYGSHLSPCGLRNDDVFGGRISYEDCVKWLSAPAGAGKDGANLVAWATTSNRIEGNTLLATAIGAAYMLTQPVESRRSTALVYGLVSVFALAVDANHAGFIPYGHNPFMTEDIAAMSAGIPCILWSILSVCFWGSFFLTPSSGKSKSS